MSKLFHLALVETSGNQNYIFSSNKLRENIGASELTYRAGTKWVLEAIAAIVPGSKSLSLWTPDGTQLRRNLLNSDRNPAIETSKLGIEVIVAASGKAIFLTKDEDTAQQIIRQVTRKALEEAPGLDVCGVIQEFDWDIQCMGDAISQVHEHFEAYRNQRITPQHRFQRIPVVQACATSGQPAAQHSSAYGDERQAISALSHAKIEVAKQAQGRLRSLLNHPEDNQGFAGTTQDLDGKCDWLAVVHADGNGLGKIFMGFHQHIGATKPSDNRDYINKLRRFSIALDQCTEAAFKTAITQIRIITKGENQPSLIPLAPLVLGGDDLTVVCDGRYALQFTRAFLKAFETETASAKHCEGIVPEIASKALHSDHLSACAGVTIIKPHFPFSVAYGLAESLIKSAKTVKQKVTFTESGDPVPCSAIDFHILYDSSVIDLAEIRRKLVRNNRHLCKRPYVVTELDHLKASTTEGQTWCEFHHWDTLSDRIAAMTKKDDETGDRLLPSSQMHELRSGLFFGQAFSDGQFRLIQKRYENQNINALEESSSSLFSQDPDSQIYCTSFLDALESLEFFETAGATP